MRILYRPVWEGMIASLREILAEGAPADKVIQRQLKLNKRWGSHDRRLFAEGVYDLVRWWRRLLFVCDVAWPESDRWTADDADVFARAIEAWTYVGLGDEVELDKAIPRSGLVRAKVKLLWDEPGLPRAVRGSMPDWLDAWAAAQLGPKWDEVLPILNQQAPAYLRVNTLRAKPDQVVAALQRAKIDAVAVSDVGLQLKQRANVFLTDAFKQGWFEMQDLHSQLVAPVLDPQPGERVIDACAGAGGKSLHLAALMKNKGKILALDVSEKKLLSLRERSTRASATLIETRLIESTKVVKRLADSADRLLLDVPCTGMGVWRRNPDSRWRLRREEITELESTQAEILRLYSQMLKKGGTMVYATCSIMPDENGKQVEKFLSQNETGWKLESEKVLWPEAGGADGFYYARLKRL